MKKEIDKEKLGEMFFKLNESVKDKERTRRALMIENIKDICNIFNNKLYKVEFEEWTGFLGQIEIFYSRTEINRFIKIKKRLIDEFGFDAYKIFDIPVTRLENIAVYSKDKEQAQELLGKANVLTSRDWRNEMNKLRRRPQMEDCKHQCVGYEICNFCGFKRKL